ncbi:Dph6-related ATP pyrophosphatase [Kordia jejudonensis]|uniref:Dph6-related ATP pyrophosphatase n=1 Tax=Kordia jejudonensis TaxID=1348245 RepID=UPI000629A83E|nr:diphthine--ammonia ligase [Kordia jejudonensis]
MKLLCSWSGGKDSCYALLKLQQKPTVLLNALNENGEMSRSHGLSKAVLHAQADALGASIHFISATWNDYTTKFIDKLKTLSNQYELTDAVFGDIDIESHREWEEKVCKEANIKCNLPLWQQERRKLVTEMIDAGIVAMIVSCNDHLGQDFLGRIINEETIALLDAKGVDICGENGEFHTVVLDCPLFHTPIDVITGEKMSNGTGYHFIELFLKEE